MVFAACPDQQHHYFLLQCQWGILQSIIIIVLFFFSWPLKKPFKRCLFHLPSNQKRIGFQHILLHRSKEKFAQKWGPVGNRNSHCVAQVLFVRQGSLPHSVTSQHSKVLLWFAGNFISTFLQGAGLSQLFCWLPSCQVSGVPSRQASCAHCKAACDLLFPFPLDNNAVA